MTGYGPKPVLAPPDMPGGPTPAPAPGGTPPAPPVPPAPVAPAPGGGVQPPAPAPAPGPSATAYRPEGLPDHLFGATEKETIDKLWGAQKGVRDEIATRGAVPKDVAGYTFEPTEALKPYAANFDKDPLFGKTREIAMKAGITDKQFQNFVAPLLDHMVTSGMVDAPVDANAQLLQLAPPGTYASDQEKSAAAAKRVQDNIAWADGAKAQKTFGAQSDAIADFFVAAAASDPRAHHAIEWLRGQGGEAKVLFGGNGGGGGQDDNALKARMNDPRNDPRHMSFDRGFAEETDRLTKARWPG
jgi:hypothetical protein